MAEFIFSAVVGVDAGLLPAEEAITHEGTREWEVLFVLIANRCRYFPSILLQNGQRKGKDVRVRLESCLFEGSH